MLSNANDGHEETDAWTAQVAANLTKSMGLLVFPTYMYGKKAQDGRSRSEMLDGMATYRTFKANPGAEIGVRLGPTSGLTAVNAFNGDQIDGLGSLIREDLICDNCDLIIRREIFVGGEPQGCYHTLIFYTGNETFLGGKTGIPGVSVEPSGEVISLPPGRTVFPLDPEQVCVTSYEFGRGPIIEYIPPMGEGLKRIIRASERSRLEEQAARPARRGVRPHLFDPVEEGGRNVELTRRAGYLIGTMRLSHSEALEALLEINRMCCKPPLPDDEVAKIAHSIAKRNERHE